MMFRKVLLASSVICANADAASDYIDSLPWHVDIVSPKADFISPQENIPSIWCNMNVLQAVSKALYLNEVPPTPGAPLSSKQQTLFKMERLLELVDDIFVHVDGPRKVPSAGTLPVYSDANALPEAKIRSLITSLLLASRMEPARLDAILEDHNSLKDPEQRLAYVAALMDQAEPEEDGVLSPMLTRLKNILTPKTSSEDLLKAGANISMDIIPDTLVGFTSSRVLTELLSTLISDNYLAGIVHEAGPHSNLCKGICNALDMGLKIDYLPDITGCTMITLIINAITCMRAVAKIDCTTVTKSNYTLDDCGLMTPVTTSSSVKQLNFQSAKDSVKDSRLTDSGKLTEGDTYYLLQYANMANDDRTTQSWCQIKDEKQLITEQLPGWPIVREVWLNEENDGTAENAPTKYSPFATMSKREKIAADDPGQCEFLIVNRGTATAWEWYMNLHLGMVPILGADDPELKAHSQYTSMGRRIMDSWNEHLLNNHFLADSTSDDYCDPNQTTLWFVGHSLGGGMTNIQAFMAAYEYKVRRNFSQMKVNALSMASLRLFNEKANQLYDQLVNVRNLRFEYDLIPSIGCPNVGLPRCDPRQYSATIHGEGVDEPQPELPNTVIIDGKQDFQDVDENLSFFNDLAFAYLTTDNPTGMLGIAGNYLNIPINLQIGVAHICSYRCFLSSNFCSSDPLKQLNCLRGSIFADADGAVTDSKKCQNSNYSSKSDLYGLKNKWLGSLNCQKNPKELGVPIAGPHICDGMMAGLSGNTILGLLGLKSNTHEEL